MKEIKYRAWDKKGRFDMSKVLIIDFNEKYVVVDAEWNKDEETGESDCVAKFEEIELMQYTGLHDKNGVAIYEGDIVKGSGGPFSIKGQIIFDQGYFGTETSLDPVQAMDDRYRNRTHGHIVPIAEYATFGCKFLEVIGNVYENPDLLLAPNPELVEFEKTLPKPPKT